MIRLDSERRARLAAAKAEIAEILDPVKAEERTRRKQDAREARKRVGKRAPGQRQDRERDPGFLAFLRRLECIAGLVEGGCSGAVQAAHTRYSDAKHGRRNSGMQAKPSDRHATPLCTGHHLHDQHTGSEIAFWSRLGVDPGELSAALYEAYLAGGDGVCVLRRFVPRPFPRDNRSPLKANK